MAQDLFEIFYSLAVPVGILSFLLMYWSLKSGRLKGEGDNKALKAEMQALKATRKDKKSKSRNPVHNKWMKFGGGFYGAVALYTFFLIEIGEIRQFINGYEGVDAMMASLGNTSVVDVLVRFVVNSLINFGKALGWPGYWVNGQRGEAIALGFLLVYGAYWAGLKLARRATRPA